MAIAKIQRIALYPLNSLFVIEWKAPLFSSGAFLYFTQKQFRRVLGIRLQRNTLNEVAN